MNPIERLRTKVEQANKDLEMISVSEALANAILKVSENVSQLSESANKKFAKIYGDIARLFVKVESVEVRVSDIENLKLKDGYTPIKGKDYFDGEDGYTPIKGKDYFDGKDGYTPVKGVDYFDGENGKDGQDGETKVVTETVVKEKELSGEKLIEKIENSRRKLDASAIKNLPEGVKETVVREIHRIGSSGIRDFLKLRDTPNSFSGQAGKIISVKSDEKGLEFIENSGGLSYANIDGGNSLSIYGGIGFNLDGGNS